MTGPMAEDSSNPLQMKDQGANPPDDGDEGRKEPDITEWSQPYSPTGDAPTSTPANPPQPRVTSQSPEDQAREQADDDDTSDDG